LRDAENGGGRFVVIDASKDIAEVTDQVISSLDELFADWHAADREEK